MAINFNQLFMGQPLRSTNAVEKIHLRPIVLKAKLDLSAKLTVQREVGLPTP